MKALVTSAVLVAITQTVGVSEVIYQNDFSGSSNPGWHRRTSGDNDFHNTWSVASSLESAGDDQYGRFDISITTNPIHSGVRWRGGFYSFLGSLTTMPLEWDLSFQIFVNALEPIRVDYRTVEWVGQSEQNTLSTWIMPASLGWNNILLDETASFSIGSGSGSPHQIGTYLTISMASHDSTSTPLSISSIGDYFFRLDNISLIAVPEPTTLFLTGTAIFALSFYRWRRRKR